MMCGGAGDRNFQPAARERYVSLASTVLLYGVWEGGPGLKKPMVPFAHMGTIFRDDVA